MILKTIGSLFSGIGGLELGLEWAGCGKTIWQVEQDEHARRVLEKHWPQAKRHKDVRLVGRSNLDPVDIVCGGFPCQDLSFAGKGAGLSGARSGLWKEFVRIIRELRPKFVVVENVPALAVRGFGVVLGDLAKCGYDAFGRAYRLPTLEPRTGASGSLLSGGFQLPTLRASDATRTDCKSERRRRSPCLVTAAIWPTLTVHGNNNRIGVGPKSGNGLATAVKLYQTRTDSQPRPLNPDWCDALMGFPKGWTVIDGPLVPVKSRKRGNLRARREELQTESIASAVSETRSSRKSHTQLDAL